MPEPEHHSIVVVDVESSSTLRDDEKIRIRRSLYEIVTNGLQEISIDISRCRIEDRGDGIYLLIPADVPKRLLANPLLGSLDRALAERAIGDTALRIRIALHSGEVTIDEHGSSGGDVDRTFAMADSDRVRAALRAAPRARMVVVVSDTFYLSVFCAHSDIDPTWLRRVRVESKRETIRAWVGIPGLPSPPIIEDSEPTAPRHTATPASVNGPVNIGRDSFHATGNGPVVQGIGRDYVTGGTVHNNGDR
jgi:hypothetical protein